MIVFKQLCVLVFCIVLGSVALAEEKTSDLDSAPQQFEGFNLQGYTEGGNKAWDVSGDTADILGNLIKLTNIDANMYGETPANLKAKRGTINKESNNIFLERDVVIVSDAGDKMVTDTLNWDRANDLVTTKDEVTITNEKLKANGIGMTAHPNLKLAQLNEDVTVHFKQVESTAEPGTEEVVITSDGPLEIDQAKNIATFNDNVVAIQPGRQLKADKMEIFFDPATKKIRELVCTGHVEVTQEGNKSFSDRAVYTAADKKVVLSGRPKLMLISGDKDGGGGFDMLQQMGSKE